MIDAIPDSVFPILAGGSIVVAILLGLLMKGPRR